MGLGAGLEYGRFPYTQGLSAPSLVQLQRPCRAGGGAYAKNLCSGRRLGASRVRFIGGSHDTSGRALLLRKTASADALPLPSLFQVFGSLQLALKNGQAIDHDCNPGSRLGASQVREAWPG
jgi:hypothetical protein